MELLCAVCTSLALSRVPSEVVPAIMGARWTALAKPNGGVRGIATGSSLRRLEARTLAKQFTKVFESESAPFQYALSTRAGTDRIEHIVRAATDNDPSLTLLSVDGIGTYDHIFRSSMLGRLLEMPRAHAILPFVRMSYAQPSKYSWVDEEGRHRIVNEAEGEQGEPLMPLLFSIGIQQALEEVAAAMVPGEQLSAFLNFYLLCQPARVKPLFKLLEGALLRCAGIQLHQGKPKPGTGQELCPTTSERWGMMLGTQRASPCWVHLSLLNSTSRGRWKSVSRKNVSCGQQYPQYPTSSVRGSSSCRVQTRARTTQ